ncbi:MAG: hypothetical protein EPO02_10120 [Nitrospirae bacterium]|nr:MAG: hypothetical protein EPO02_10120 [Nitrospirota bacterium]
MSRTLNTLAAGALALALIVPAYAGTSAPAPSSTPSVTQAKAPVGKTTLKKGKHGKKGTQKKQHSTTAPAPAPSTAPATH